MIGLNVGDWLRQVTRGKEKWQKQLIVNRDGGQQTISSRLPPTAHRSAWVPQYIFADKCFSSIRASKLLSRRPFLRAAASEGATWSGSMRVLWLASNFVDTIKSSNVVSKTGMWIRAREFGWRYGHGEDGIAQPDIHGQTVNPGVARMGSYAGTGWAPMTVLDVVVMHDTIYGACTELYTGLSPDIGSGEQAGLTLPWG